MKLKGAGRGLRGIFRDPDFGMLPKPSCFVEPKQTPADAARQLRKAAEKRLQKRAKFLKASVGQ